MAEPPNVRLRLANKPENVLLVREMLVGVGEALELDRNDLEDIRTAVSEACNNVVLHAYEGHEGPLEVELGVCEGAIEVLVRDRGVGLQPRTHISEQSTAGLGLPVIGALARRVEFSDGADRGTEVRMEFAAPGARSMELSRKDPLELPDPAPGEFAEFAGTVVMSLAPTILARPVLPRVFGVLAAHAHFSTDRIGDAQLLADTIAVQVPGTLGDGHLGIGVQVKPRRLDLHIGPLKPGGAQLLIAESATEGLGSVVEKLADAHHVTSEGPSEMLALRMIDRR